MTSQPPPGPARSGNRALASAAALMASGTLVSRILGLVRNALLVAVVGSLGQAANAWSVSNKLPNIISMLLAGGILNAVLVPQVVKAMKRPDGGQDYVNRLLTAAIAFLGGLTIVLTAAATLLVTMYAADVTPEWKAVAVALAYWCIPQLFFYGLYTLLGQVLNARSIFGPYMWAPVVNNVIAIAGLVAFLVTFGGLPDGGIPASAWTGDKIMVLAGTATLGVVAQALVLVVPLYRSGFRYRPVWGLRGHGLGSASTVAMWAFAALAVGQLGYLAVSNLAASAGTAGAAAGADYAGNFAYDNAFLVFMLPQSLVTVSLVTALFTRVAHNAAARDGAKVRDDLSLGLRTLSVFTVLATAGFAVLAVPLVQVVVLDRANFASYRAVGAVLVAMAFGLVSIAVWTMVQRVFYAYEDTRTLFRIQVPMAGLLVLGCLLSWWLLEPQWWVVGAGVATTVSNTVGAGVGYLATRKYLPNLDGGRVLRTHLRVIIAVIPPALAAWGLLHLWGVQTSLLGALVRVIVLGVFIVAGYLVLLRVFGVSEVDGFLARLGRFGGPVLRRLGGSGTSDGPRSMSEPGASTGKGMAQVSSEPTVAPVAGDLIADRFQLQTPISGAGSPAVSWLAQDRLNDEPVRVLLMSGPTRDHAVDASRRAALIDDPRLPRVLRAGIHAGYGFAVTQAVTGHTLTQLLAGGPLAPSQARAIVGEAASALEVARRRGVHHLALTTDSIVRTPDGQVRVIGLSVDGALAGADSASGREAGRRDAVGLVSVLYAALTATWPGAPELACGLAVAERQGDGPVPVGDVVPSVPNDLDTLCAVTLGKLVDGPFTPAELVADLAPWEAVSSEVPVALPPVVRPGDGSESAPDAVDVAADASGVGGSGVGGSGAGGSGAGGSGAGFPTGAAGDDPQTAIMAAVASEPSYIGPVDTSGWAPHPLPAASEPTPFADLVVDTGAIPVVRGPQHANAAPYRLTQQRHEVRLSDEDTRVNTAAGVAGAAAGVAGAAAGVAGATTASTPSATTATDPTAADPAVINAVAGSDPTDTNATSTDTSPSPTSAAGADSSAWATQVWANTPAVDPPDHEATIIATPSLAVDPEKAADAAVDPAVRFGGYPRFTSVARGWDLPGGAGPELLPVPEPVASVPEPDSGSAEVAADDDASGGAAALAASVGTATEGAARAFGDRFAAATSGIRQTNRRINEASDKVTGGARKLAGEAGSRFGSIGERAGSFVRDVREEFEPVDADDEGRSRFNPAPIVLTLMLGLLIFGLVMAVVTLRDAGSSFVPVSTTQPGAATETAEAPTDGATTVEPTTPPPAAANVTITGGITFDPTAAGGENQDDAYLAYDGRTETTWNSLRYNSPTYGMKPGLGYTVTFAEEATISSVTLNVAGEGGMVEIRLGNEGAPNTGDVLASGAMGPNVTYTFEQPVQASSISLWFPELPVATSDGRNRIELAEISFG